MLRRLVRVSGFRDQADLPLRVWRFPVFYKASSFAFDSGTGALTLSPTFNPNGVMGAFGNPFRPWPIFGLQPTLASELRDIGALVYSTLTADRQSLTPRPELVTNFAPARAYLYDAAGINPVIEWEVAPDTYWQYVDPVTDLINAWAIRIRSGTLVGTDFNFAQSAAGYLAFNGIRDVSAATRFEKTVWARISEIGARSTLQSLGGGTQQTVVRETAAQAYVRFDVDLLGADMLVDDLGREWAIENADAVMDRRYLALGLSRRESRFDYD